MRVNIFAISSHKNLPQATVFLKQNLCFLLVQQERVVLVFADTHFKICHRIRSSCVCCTILLSIDIFEKHIVCLCFQRKISPQGSVSDIVSCLCDMRMHKEMLRAPSPKVVIVCSIRCPPCSSDVHQVSNVSGHYTPVFHLQSKQPPACPTCSSLLISSTYSCISYSCSCIGLLVTRAQSCLRLFFLLFHFYFPISVCFGFNITLLPLCIYSWVQITLPVTTQLEVIFKPFKSPDLHMIHMNLDTRKETKVQCRKPT